MAVPYMAKQKSRMCRVDYFEGDMVVFFDTLSVLIVAGMCKDGGADGIEGVV